MSDAKKEVMKMVNNRQKLIKRLRERRNTRVGPYSITADFIKAIENAIHVAKSPMDLDSGIQDATRIYNQRMSSLDPEIQIDVIWNEIDKVNNWDQLNIEGVIIKWSRFYLGKNPFEHSELKIDVATLFLEGYLGDQDD